MGLAGSLYSSVLLIGLSLYVQLKLEDTEAFKELAEASQPTEAKPRSPVLKALTTYPKEIALAAGSFLGVQVTFYICVAFIISYGTDPEGLNIARSDMLTAVLISTMFAIPANFFSVHGQTATDAGAYTSWAQFSPGLGLCHVCHDRYG